MQCPEFNRLGNYRVVIVSYAALGVVLAFLFLRLSSATEVREPQNKSSSAANLKTFFVVGHSHQVVLKLSSIFALDSFAGGFVLQSFAAYWFYLRFAVNPGTLGAIFFWANVFAGISALDVSLHCLCRKHGLLVPNRMPSGYATS
jgi:hypothetical protein